MGKNSKIEWTDHTFNPWWGCTHHGVGCDNCYAESSAKRWGWNVWGANANRRWMTDKYWKMPLKWDEQVLDWETGKHVSGYKDGKYTFDYKKTGEGVFKDRVFCGSMCDVFEIHKDPLINSLMVAERLRLCALIEKTVNLEWLLLTKRIDNVNKNTLPSSWWDKWPENVRLGITVVSQKEAERDIPKLLALDVPNFLSLEPLLGEINLEPYLANWYQRYVGRVTKTFAYEQLPEQEPGIHWVIVGGESGHNARPMHPQWARKLRDQCSFARTPFFFKQWGEYLAVEDKTSVQTKVFWFDKVGKKKAGSLLDGKEHKEFPNEHATN